MRLAELMRKCATMWDEHVGRVLVAKNRINLNPSDAPPIDSSPYKAVSRQRQLDKEEIEKMFQID